ncbi:MAG TPA: DNA methyltransferase, partial [Candidatus Absconditabacterales bacterium]|nr:DNA methyltransferase [Candidatus Absconditabacterales bacterium]
MFKKTESIKTDSGEDKYNFDTQIEDIVDESSEEVIGYKVTFINYEESKDTKKQKETMIADVLESKGIQYSNPAIKKSIDEFLKKRGRDYFIHKRLKAFLTEELERYFFQMLKTDIQAKADILSIQKKIEEIKAKYSDDQAVIDFKIGQLMKESQSDVKLSLYETSYLWILNFVNILADLEEFKAKLWNKKRKIVKQEYCISIGKIKELETLIPRREEILKAIDENKTQIQEWEDLGMKTDSNYLENDFLVVDTKNFSGKIKEYLLELARSNEIIGKLFQSDNYQFLNSIERTKKLKIIYIDPPYNTGSDDFIYKDNYQSASWLSLMTDRLRIAKRELDEDGLIFIS